MITPEQAQRMADREIFNLIFLPGFSTARKGHQRFRPRRGHGCRENECGEDWRHGGSASDAGKRHDGSSEDHADLAIIPALIVTCGEDRYAIRR